MLINMTVGTQLGIKALLSMDGTPKANKNIARDLGVSSDHLSKVLQLLKRHRIIRAVRGPRGGYRMVKPASEITVVEVMSAVEGGILTEPEGHELHPIERFLGSLHNDIWTKLAVPITEI
jgi:Rrf2 family protein